MKVLYFGIYDPAYARNWVIINGLRKNGVEVVELREKPARLCLLKLAFRYLLLKKSFDLVIVGFPGQEVMFLAKALIRKPIIFDAFTSHYGGYVLDRKKWPEKSWRASYFKFLDKWSCKLSNLALLDTESHINFFVNEFKLDRNKFLRIFVGTDYDIFYPQEIKKETNKFLVHFHGHYIPLQGVKFIIKAAKFLEKDGVHFNIVGSGQTFKDDLRLAESLGVDNVSFINPVPYEELSLLMAKADICLGIFGDSPKTDLVIPNKVYEAMAMGKPIVTADTPAARELLSDGQNVLFCHKADAEVLAEKIKFLKEHPDRLRVIGEGAKKLFQEKLTDTVLAAELLKHINEKRILPK